MKVLYLLHHELRRLFFAPSTYLAMVLALSLMGFFFFLTLVSVSAEPQEQQPATLYFSLFWIPVLLLVPMLTMRSFAEERRQGTIETLLTAPIRPVHVVVAKFGAAYLFYLLVWALSLLYLVLTASFLGQPGLTERLFDQSALAGGLTFIAISGALFVSIGIFSSSLTRSQLVSGMLTFSILFMLIVGIAAIELINLNPKETLLLGDTTIAYFQVFSHFEDFSRGILDSRPFVYYLSGSIAVLALSVHVLESKN